MDWEFELIAGPYGGTTEGPAWDGEALLFTHIPESRILRYDPRSGAVTEFRKYTSRTNGLAFSANGHLYGCQSGSRRIVRFNSDGSTSVLADRLDGYFRRQAHSCRGCWSMLRSCAWSSVRTGTG
jgi:sugar lactone lactonase YvrE